MEHTLIDQLRDMCSRAQVAASLAELISRTRDIALFSLAFYSMRRDCDLSFTLGSQILKLPNSRGRQRPNGLNPALPAEIKLLQVLFLARETEHKPHQVPRRCHPVRGCGTLAPARTGIVLRERSANGSGRSGLGECSTASEDNDQLPADTSWMLNRSKGIICRGELSAAIPSIHVIGRWVTRPGNH